MGNRAQASPTPIRRKVRVRNVLPGVTAANGKRDEDAERNNIATIVRKTRQRGRMQMKLANCMRLKYTTIRKRRRERNQ